MRKAMETRTVCRCCALVMSNSDESGCRDYDGHTHPACSLTVDWVLGGADGTDYWGTPVDCFGCGRELEPGAELFEAVRLG